MTYLGTGRGVVIPSVIIFVGALLLYSINLDRLPHPDELHHVLAAIGMVDSGEPLIAEGEYTRGLFYTWMVATSFKIFGIGLDTARIPSILFAALTVSLLFVWVCSQTNKSAAWFSTILFATSPFVISLAQFSRFYTPQMFCFLAGSILVFTAITAKFSFRLRIFTVLCSIPFILIAVYFQITTIFGVIGIAIWTFFYFSLKYTNLVIEFLKYNRKYRWLLYISISTVFAVSLIAIGIYYNEILNFGYLQAYRKTPIFNQANADNFIYYLLRYFLFYPLLVGMSCLLVVLSAIRWSKLTWFIVSIFVCGLLFNSFAAAKAMRYVAYLQPFIFIFWGMGVSALVALLAPSILALVDRLTLRLSIFGSQRRKLAIGIVSITIVSIAFANPFWLRSVTVMADIALPIEEPNTNWPAARSTLKPWINDADIVITTEELGALYFLGRYDIRFSPSKLGELAPEQQRPFGIDHRTGRPIIADNNSVIELIDCFESGLVVGPIKDWGSPILINPRLVQILENRTSKIELPVNSHVFARGWENPSAKINETECKELADLIVGKPASE